MRIILVIAALILAGLYFVERNSARQFQRICLILLVAVLLGLGVQIYLSSRPEGTDFLSSFDEAVAHALANVAMNGLESGNEVAVLLPTEEGADERGRQFVASVRKGLQDAASGAGVVLTESSSTNRPVAIPFMPEPIGLFRDALNEAPGAKALISFVGLPDAHPRSCRNFPPIYTLEYRDGPGPRAWLGSGVAQGVAVLKENYDRMARPRKRQSLPEIFDLRYVMLLPPGQELPEADEP